MKRLLKTTTLSLVTATAIYAGGYKIPEVSTNGVALSAANIAHGHGADAAYYNPANMAFMEDRASMEADLLFIGLDSVKFQGAGSMAGVDIEAEKEAFIIPSFNYVSSDFNGFRAGFSMVVPGGLSKRWSDTPAKDTAEEFTLEVVELNPTLAYRVTDTFSLAVGLRAIHSAGIVKSSSTASRDMTGDSFDFGYNVALAYKPTDALELAVTYRSEVELKEEGNAKLYIGDAKVYDGGSSVNVPLPAFFTVAASYTFESKTTVEFVYERNFWSAYDSLDFDYSSAIPNILQPSFDGVLVKDWKDTDAYRLGITQELESMTLMVGAVYDNNPIPDEKLSFELPDSNALSLSLGGRYKINESMDVGVSALYSIRDERSAKNDNVEGTFSNSNVLILSTGIGYKF